MSDMWPTPNGAQVNYMEDPEQWKNRNDDRQRNGSQAFGLPLGVAAQRPDLFSSPEGSPASPSPKQEIERARRMTATSGRKWSALLTNSGPLGYLVKMLTASSRWTAGDLSTKYLLTWTASGTRAKRSLFRLSVSERRTDDTASGLWAAASARDYKDTQGMSLEGTNPDGSKRDRTDRLPTQVYVQMYPTPASQSQAGGTRGLEGGSGARETLRKAGAMELASGNLNPDWVECLMGYPIGWTLPDGPPLLDHTNTIGSRQESPSARKTEPTD